MKRQRNLVMLSPLGVAVIVALLLVQSATLKTTNRDTGKTATEAGNTASGVAQPPVDAATKNASASGVSEPGRFTWGATNLNSASMDEVGQFAREFAQHQLKAKGTPKIRLVRTITREDVTAFGLGCLPDFASIEQPPLVLTILEGEFDFRGSIPGSNMADAPVPGRTSYVAYIFDVWSALPVAIRESQDGALVKKALNDPTLPDPDAGSLLPSECPTQIPASQKTLHYGQAAPGFTSPPPLPEDIQKGSRSVSVSATPTNPTGSTPIMPEPVPTAVGFPTIPPPLDPPVTPTSVP